MEVKIDPVEARNSSSHADRPSRIPLDPKLYDAVVEGNLEVLDDFLQSQYLLLLDGVTIGGSTVLHIAASSNRDLTWQRTIDNVDFAREVCLRNRSLLTACNTLKETPVHCAAKAGNYRMVSRLISFAEEEDQAVKQTLLTARNIHGETALHEAVRVGHGNIVNKLILSEPSITGIVDLKGVSPLYLATMMNALNIVKIFTNLNEEPSRVSCAGPDGQTALHVAVLEYTGITHALLEWNKSLATMIDDSKSTPLHYAASVGNLETVKLLLGDGEIKKAAYMADKNGLFPIHTAAKCGEALIIKELIKHFPDSDELLDTQGRNMLHLAILSGQGNIIVRMRHNHTFLRMLNARDYQENTPLHLAGERGQYRIVKFLISMKMVYSSIINRNGQTPVDLAFKFFYISKRETLMATNQGDLGDPLAAKMATKLAARKATEKTIATRNAQIAEFRSKSYAQALTRAMLRETATTDAKRPTAFKRQEKEGAAIKDHALQIQLQDNTDAWGNKIPIDEGWIEVRRKKNLTQPKPVQPHQWREELLAQGRCFKCLARGHRRFQCKNQLKCHNCALTGHIARVCTQKRIQPQAVKKVVGIVKAPKLLTKGTIPKVVDPQPAVLNHTQTEQNSKEQEKSNKMDVLENWETMAMTDPGYIIDNRVEEMKVFLPTTEGYAPANQFLSRSVVVLAGPNQNDRILAHQLERKLAYHFHTHPRNIKVRKIPPSIGDFIAIFPTEDMRKQAVDTCVFVVQPGVEVQLTAWTKQTGMVYDPTTHKARLRLYDLPHQFWNWGAIAQLVSGFGSLERVAPFFTNDNFEDLRILVGVYHPYKIPPTLGTTAQPCSVSVRVELEGWIHNSVLETESPHDGEHKGENEPVQDEAMYWEEQWRGTLRGGRRLNSYDSRQSSGPVTRYNRRVRQMEGWAPIAAKLDNPVSNKNAEDRAKIQTEIFDLSKKKEMTARLCVSRVQGSNWIFGADIKCDGKREQFFMIIPNVLSQEWISDLMSTMPKYTVNATSLQQTAVKETFGPQHLEERNQGESDKEIQIEYMGFTQEAQIREGIQYQVGPDEKTSEIEEGYQAEQENEARTGELHFMPSSQDITEGPPPGFPGKPKYASPARRSPRLSQKNNGPYVGPEERARRVSKPNSVSILHGGSKRAVKGPQAQAQAQLDYFKTNDPLSEDQARLVTMAAGVELHGQVEKHVGELLVN